MDDFESQKVPSPLTPSIMVLPEVATIQKEMIADIERKRKTRMPLHEIYKEPKEKKKHGKVWYGGLLNGKQYEICMLDNMPVFFCIDDSGKPSIFTSLENEKEDCVYVPPKKIAWAYPNVKLLSELKGEDLDMENLYDCLKELIKDQIYLLDEEYYDIIALWILATYYIEHIKVAPYLLFLAEKISGKTTALKLIAELCYRGVLFQDITEAALVRELQNKKITALIDEATEYMLKEKNLFGALLCGNMKGINYVRVSDKDFNDTDYWDLFCFKALASPSPYSDHLSSRCITINMAEGRPERKSTSEQRNRILSILYYLKMTSINSIGNIGNEGVTGVTKENDNNLSVTIKNSALNVTSSDRYNTYNNNNNNNNIIEQIGNPRIRDLMEALLPLITVTSVTTANSIIENIKFVAQKLVTDIETEAVESFDAKIIDVYCQVGMCSASQIKEELCKPPYSLEKVSTTTIGRRLKALGFTSTRTNKQRTWEIRPKRLELLIKRYGLEDVKPKTEQLELGENNGQH